MRVKKSLVNDRLSPTSLIIVRKVTRNEIVFLCVPLFMLDRTFQNIYGTLWNVFGHSLFYYRTPTKILALSGTKSHAYKFKQVGSINLHSLVSFNSTYFPVSNTR